MMITKTQSYLEYYYSMYSYNVCVRKIFTIPAYGLVMAL